MASNVDIVNIALTNLGADTIMALDEESEGARKANVIYDIVRDIVLTKHPWNFAIKQAELSLLDETPVFKFTYIFQLPGDYLRVLEMEDEDVEFKIKGRKLYTDTGTVKIEYIARITDSEQFSAGFISAFSDELAARLAYPITNSRAIATDMRALALANLRVAKAEDAQEGTPDGLDADEWLNSRKK